MSAAGFVVADEGLGGIVPFGNGLAKLGVTPVLLTGAATKRQLRGWGETYAEVRVLEDPYSPDSLVEAARDIAGAQSIAALFSCYDGLSLAAAVAAERLGVPHPGIPGLARSRNKLAMRHVMNRAGVPPPRFAALGSVEECAGARARVGAPAI